MRTRNAQLRPQDVLDISPDDARQLNVNAGERVNIVSRYGQASLPINITGVVKGGELFTTFHTAEAFLNQVTSPFRDGYVGAPEYKVTAVRIERTSPQPGGQVRQEYRRIQKKLQERYAEIQHRLARISSDLRRVNQPLNADSEEQGQELENDEVLNAPDQSIRAEMTQIQKTLRQIERGEYGTCRECGCSIPLNRLEVLPHASLCVECARGRDTA
jgi:RNA polymerase-binding transcription factor DksA